MPFDMQLKKAMGMQNAGPMGQMGGPDSLMALVNKMGPNQFGSGTGTNERIAQVGQLWDGKEFKPGQTKRCADFVSTVIEKSGAAPPGFQREINCLRLQKYGRKIERKDLKPGDIVYFGNTYMAGDYTHVGIYTGNNKFVHRPTAAKPVRTDDLSGYYSNKFCGARRLNG
ncbi:MAG: C40 family peptidase [Candidatus Eremiobacteraeota bacterium]|nr:C40 family peptidase [Candidatus Eremiobacteraeota bacterium]